MVVEFLKAWPLEAVGAREGAEVGGGHHGAVAPEARERVGEAAAQEFGAHHLLIEGGLWATRLSAWRRAARNW
jgi:hypothetical protein